MIIEDVVEFLRESPPLSFLEPARLEALARRAALEFFPMGEQVLGSGASGEGHVVVVKKGAVQAGDDLHGEGSVLGWLPGPAVARDDAVCYLLPPEAVAQALRGRADLCDFLEDRLTPEVLELGLAGIVREIPAWLSRRPLATVTAGEAARLGDPLPAGTSLRQAAEVMTATDRDAVVVLGPEGRPAGVVTDRDFRTKAVGQGLSPHAPVEQVMTSPVVSLNAGDSCFDALMAMTRHHIKHVVVMAGRICAGVLSSQELLLRQVGSPPALAARIAQARTVEELARVAELLDPLALGLLREGARASGLGRIVGGLREALAARACQLAEEVLGPAPSGYALMLLGRAARREGPALCPLWNAVVHEDLRECRAGRAAADQWFERLGSFLSEALEIMNLAGGPGSPSAGSAAWRGDPGQWRERVEAWVEQGPPDPGHLDFRPVHGQPWLVESLRAHLTVLAGNRQRLAGPPPGGDLSAFLVDSVRSWSLGKGITRISSVERARALAGVRPVGQELAAALEYATAWQWVGEPLRRGPLARALERMCRKAAGRAENEMVAMG